MVIAPRGPDVELQRLRQSSRADDAPERTRALRELLRMDWRRARDAVMAALAEGAWADRALVLRALAGRADPLAKELRSWRSTTSNTATRCEGRERPLPAARWPK